MDVVARAYGCSACGEPGSRAPGFTGGRGQKLTVRLLVSAPRSPNVAPVTVVVTAKKPPEAASVPLKVWQAPEATEWVAEFP